VVNEYRERERALRRDLGHDVHLVCPPRWSEGGSVVAATQSSDIPVHILPVHGRPHPILFWYDTRALRQVLRAVKPDIVDIHEEPYSLATAAALGAVSAEVPDAAVTVYTAQNIYKRYPLPIRSLEKRAMRRAACCYPCSSEAAEVMQRKGYTGGLHVIPLGVSVPRERHVHGPGSMTVGFLGRLERYKGTDIAIAAFAEVARSTDLQLEVLGDGSDLGAMRASADALGVGDRVRFRGAVSQEEALRRILEFDVVLIPSRTTPTWKEQFGRVAAQAMAAGVPVVASASGSLPEVTGDVRMLAAEGDVTAFAQRLRTLVHDPALRAEVASSARLRAEKLYDWRQVAEAFDRMYRRAVDGDPTGWSYATAA
jgi:glycosyltransferase involved in cell wall biosynthesis